MRERAIGGVLLALAALALLLAGSFVGAGWATGQVSPAGAVLGFILFGAFPAAALAVGGVFLLTKGREEAQERQRAAQLERLLGMIRARGQVPLDQAMIELKMTREEVQQAIYELVSLGLFAGYVDWDAMVFYSMDAGKVGTNKCPNCGGIREFVGKGVVKCPYCGVMLFIPPDAPQTRAEPHPPEKQPAPQE